MFVGICVGCFVGRDDGLLVGIELGISGGAVVLRDFLLLSLPIFACLFFFLYFPFDAFGPFVDFEPFVAIDFDPLDPFDCFGLSSSVLFV